MVCRKVKYINMYQQVVLVTSVFCFSWRKNHKFRQLKKVDAPAKDL